MPFSTPSYATTSDVKIQFLLPVLRHSLLKILEAQLIQAYVTGIISRIAKKMCLSCFQTVYTFAQLLNTLI